MAEPVRGGIAGYVIGGLFIAFGVLMIISVGVVGFIPILVGVICIVVSAIAGAKAENAVKEYHQATREYDQKTKPDSSKGRW